MSASTCVRTSGSSIHLRGETERRRAARARVDHRRHAAVDADPVGREAEVAEARVHVHVQVDQAGRDDQPLRVDDLRARRARRGADAIAAIRPSSTSTSAISSRPARDRSPARRAPARRRLVVARGRLTVSCHVAHTPWIRALIVRCRRSISSSPGSDDRAVFDDELAVHHRVARRDRAAAQPRLDRIGQRTRERDALERPAHEVADRARPRAARSRRRDRGTRPSPASRSPARRARPSTSGPCAGARAAARCAPPSTATRSRSTPSRRSRDRRARPRPRNSGTGAMPPPPMSMFELGQCATPVPHLPSRAISSSFG